MSRPINRDDVYRAVAHPVRRKIIELLRERPRTPDDLIQSFKITQPSLSRHLRGLRDARIVVEKRQGRRRLYSYNARPLQSIARWISSVV
ncbi:MAG: ArsR/SmtB family transcription factor [Phycisphaerales bacterium]